MKVPDFKQLLKKTPGIRPLVKLKRGFTGRPLGSAFNGDGLRQRLVLDCLDRFQVTAFVETGTYKGSTTEGIAFIKTDLPIYSMEIKREFYEDAKARLRGYKNIDFMHISSEQGIPKLLQDNKLGKLPMFYLDAHWYDYWPLLDEIRIITTKIDKAIIIVDDFQVPGHDQFIYCTGGGGSNEFSGRQAVDERICNYSLIQPFMNPTRKYKILYPKYTHKQAGTKSDKLAGYAIIFQNLGELLLPFGQQRFVNYFWWYND
jgi:hypothetical protein